MRREPSAQPVTYARILGGIAIWQATRLILPPFVAFGLIWLERSTDASMLSSKALQLLVLAIVPVVVYVTALAVVWKLFERSNLRTCTRPYYYQPVGVLDVCVGTTVGVLLAVIWLYVSSDSGNLITAIHNSQQAGLGSFALLAFLALTIVCVVVAAPIAEEVFYRGLLLEALSSRVNSALSVCAIALVFAVSHAGSVPNRWEAYAIIAVLAIAASALTLRSGSVGGAVVMHFSFNLVPIVRAALD